ncbi:MAG: response regulator transcription factor [Lentisphaerae bacterium]|jgi:two-component system, NarL family, response regulator NreC|nr:response regulator transcription factor [Lentisphaerota bacterium]MBT4818599.1 response regulator transcription factor [Lentisphaerota bacterium]MBT5604506.1 response regulator transcription factor [Lentisphaerota bacterium]MBT7060507.1 response regulator transcription factor [Lentisphaerota bacterium]MBT7844414.1 response regulator transcription factor [Lentisphaerota bacterium]
MKILLADDHRLMREGLRSLLARQSGMDIVGEADNGITAVQLARELTPDVVIMDIAMPDLNGIEATRQIKAELPETKILGLSMHADRRFVKRMLAAGASGYMLKACAFEEVAKAVRAVMAGRVYTSPRITDLVLEDYIQQLSGTVDEGGTLLSDREREVLQLLAEGKSTRDIADCLHVSTTTVDTHRKHIMDKLGLHNVAELTKYAIREGLTALDE